MPPPPAPEPLFDLACAACGAAYPDAGWPDVCPHCGGCWRYGDGLAWRPPTGAGGLRRWAPALGLDPEELPARSLASSPGLLDTPGDGGGAVWICQQGAEPAGSYKERGA